MQKQYLGEIIDSLIEDGLQTPSQIAPKLHGMDAKKVMTFLINNRKLYIKQLISSIISKGYTTTIQIAEKLELISQAPNSL